MRSESPVKAQYEWTRLDVPGREASRFRRVDDGWEISGAVDVADGGITARLRYRIDCDTQWITRGALIDGTANERPVHFAFRADGVGTWWVDGERREALQGALDIDLGFTPATNTLPIRRLSLTIGERARVRSTWLRFPELRVEALEQTYSREDERGFRYEAEVDGELFTARLDVDAFGGVLAYEGLWRATSADATTA